MIVYIQFTKKKKVFSLIKMHQLYYGLLFAVFGISSCCVLCQLQHKTQQNRYNCRLESIICRFPSKISLSIPYPMNYWPNFPVFH